MTRGVAAKALCRGDVKNMSEHSDHPSRRVFCGRLGLGISAAALAATAMRARAAEPTEKESGFALPENLAAKGEVPRRKFGKTDVVISALGLGGHTFALAKSEQESIRIVQEAVDSGITFLDNAWEYHDGKSEELMGRALAEGKLRDKVFLMTKCCTHGRDKKVAMQQLEESLRRLRTDHLDLWQIHEVVYYDDPARHFAPGGAVEALLEARQQGKVRFIGFTGHKDPEIHLDMLSRNFPFDSVQMPLSGFDASFRSFQKRVLPEVTKRGMAAIGMKSLNGTADAVKKGVIQAADAIRYAMSLPVAVTVSGVDSLDLLRENVRIARGFSPMNRAERVAFEKQCAVYAMDGRFELYKTTAKFEGPPGREQHGFPAKEEVSA
jgi:aryl-alcohol dehydrogenase-like predicted oxidoreductase